MNDIYPHLVGMTCIEDIRRVYFLDLGVSFNELSDEEKELAYNSQQYLAEKYCEKLKESFPRISGRSRSTNFQMNQTNTLLDLVKTNTM